MKILALDQATKCGWATDTASGVWDFSPNRGESGGMRLVRFKAKLKEILELEKIDLVAYERVQGRFQSTVIVSAELAAIIQTVCHDNAVEVACYSPKEIKKHATGKGNANKDMMVKAAQKKWPSLDIVSNDHADALWILDYAKKDLL